MDRSAIHAFAPVPVSEWAIQEAFAEPGRVHKAKIAQRSAGAHPQLLNELEPDGAYC